MINQGRIYVDTFDIKCAKRFSNIDDQDDPKWKIEYLSCTEGIFRAVYHIQKTVGIFECFV